MKFKFKALTVGCIAAMGMASASAIEVAGANLEVYGTLYPQMQTTTMGGDFTPTGGAVSNLTTGTTATAAGAPAANAIRKNQLNWVNSYVGFKGVKAFGDVKVGFDLQGTLNRNVDSTAGVNTNNALFSDTRDAFLFVESKSMGKVSLGQLDTIYKEYGDRVRMLGVSSSNFVSTSGIVSGVSWKALSATNGVATGTATTGGITSFNTRIGGQLRYETPVWNGVQAGLSYRPDASASSTQNQSLTGMGVKWTNGTYYVAYGQETHNDYRAFSGTTTGTYTATSLRSVNPRSKDQANRVSAGYVNGPLQLAADYSNLSYMEQGTVGTFGKYTTSAWQVSVDYALNANWNLAANYAVGEAGSCERVGGAACSTQGLGGSLLSLGGKYNFDKNVSIFGIYGSNKNNASGFFGSPTNAGGIVTNMAVGVLVKF
jgi:predicted porin